MKNILCKDMQSPAKAKLTVDIPGNVYNEKGEIIGWFINVIGNQANVKLYNSENSFLATISGPKKENRFSLNY